MYTQTQWVTQTRQQEEFWICFFSHHVGPFCRLWSFNMAMICGLKGPSLYCCALRRPLACSRLCCLLRSQPAGHSLEPSRLEHSPYSQNLGLCMSATSSSVEPAAIVEPLLQYVVLRKDLWETQRWPLGSIVAQACHATTAALWSSRDSPETLEYCSESNLDTMHKVVLEIKGVDQLHTLSKSLTEANIPHKLWTEQPENVPTSLATAPNRKAVLQPYFKKLKLCKGLQLKQ